MTRFLVMSDTHELTLSHLQKVPTDVVLHCGDITKNGNLKRYEQLIDYFCTLTAELKLVIAGNHDLTLDPDNKTENYNAARSLWKSDKCGKHNIHYLREGYHRFDLSTGKGFTVYASPYTPQFGDSAFQYPTNEDRYSHPSTETPKYAKSVPTSASTIPSDEPVDIVMTHGPPKYILDRTSDGNSGGCEHLRRAVNRVRPRLHCFGHIRCAWGSQRIAWRSQLSKEEADEADAGYERTDYAEADDAIVRPIAVVGRNSMKKRGYAWVPTSTQAELGYGKETLFVNAAVGNHDNAPENLPWVIDLALGESTKQERGTKRKRESLLGQSDKEERKKAR